jgi:dimethylhistidine N-methyltransferase
MALPQQRPAQGVVRFYNFLPAGDAFLEDVLEGMAQSQKSLPSKYLYDAQGCKLLQHIRELPDNYIARAELALLRAHAGEIARFLGAACQLIELGPGSSKRTRILIEELQPPLYVLIGIDGDAMQATADSLVRQFPWLNIVGVRADYARRLILPEFAGVTIRKKAVYFPGSDLGQFNPEDAPALLKRARRMLGSGGALLVGLHLKQDKALLEAVCNDAAGVSAAFNLNLLARINRELGADFQLRRFVHRAHYDESRNQVEMQIASLAVQLAHVGHIRLRFDQGETILTQVSCMYSAEEFHAMARLAGFEPAQTWTDAGNLFSLHAMIAT